MFRYCFDLEIDADFPILNRVRSVLKSRGYGADIRIGQGVWNDWLYDTDRPLDQPLIDELHRIHGVRKVREIDPAVATSSDSGK